MEPFPNATCNRKVCQAMNYAFDMQIHFIAIFDMEEVGMLSGNNSPSERAMYNLRKTRAEMDMIGE